MPFYNFTMKLTGARGHLPSLGFVFNKHFWKFYLCNKVLIFTMFYNEADRRDEVIFRDWDFCVTNFQ